LDYVEEGYKTTEVKKRENTALMGYGQALALKHERKGERRASWKPQGTRCKEGFSIAQIARITGISVGELGQRLKDLLPASAPTGK
jgi:hypothetical protein